MTIDADPAYYGDDAATLGDRIVAAREAMGSSRKDLAKRLGVKLKTVQAWEDDRTEPRANKAQMMSGILGVSLIWLLSGEGEGVSEPTDLATSSDELHDILGDIRKLKVEMAQSARKLSAIEKQLRKIL